MRWTQGFRSGPCSRTDCLFLYSSVSALLTGRILYVIEKGVWSEEFSGGKGMPGKTLMVLGTASSVGKSIVTAALCRILRQDGFDVAPFKAQNMSLNSFVTPTGGEIGRAQAVQAEAACVEPTVDMNPILLKPERDDRSQVVVRGKPLSSLSAIEYYSKTDKFWSIVTESLDTLRAAYDIIVMEGAGSPAEVNLKDKDIVNMRVALYCQAPVLLVADIDKGGVFASVVGTLDLLEPEERSLVKGIVINKFRGDISLFESGVSWLEEKTGLPVVGVIPYFHDIHIAEEDSVSLGRRLEMKQETDYVLDIAVIAHPHLSNFDDFDPLAQEEGVRLRYVEANDDLGDPDLIILPGTKSTAADLEYLIQRGLDKEVVTRAEAGTPVIGICGGYQMLGERILDPEGVESKRSDVQGLGLLPVTTTFSSVKSTHQVKGKVQCGDGILKNAEGLPVTGYEIHMGQTSSETSPFLIEERSRKDCHDLDGCVKGDVLGTYIHGLFHNEGLRRAILLELAERKGVKLPPFRNFRSREEELDMLADHVRSSLDINLVYDMMGLSNR